MGCRTSCKSSSRDGRDALPTCSSSFRRVDLRSFTTGVHGPFVSPCPCDSCCHCYPYPEMNLFQAPDCSTADRDVVLELGLDLSPSRCLFSPSPPPPSHRNRLLTFSSVSFSFRRSQNAAFKQYPSLSPVPSCSSVRSFCPTLATIPEVPEPASPPCTSVHRLQELCAMLEEEVAEAESRASVTERAGGVALPVATPTITATTVTATAIAGTPTVTATAIAGTPTITVAATARTPTITVAATAGTPTITATARTPTTTNTTMTTTPPSPVTATPLCAGLHGDGITVNRRCWSDRSLASLLEADTQRWERLTEEVALALRDEELPATTQAILREVREKMRALKERLERVREACKKETCCGVRSIPQKREGNVHCVVERDAPESPPELNELRNRVEWPITALPPAYDMNDCNENRGCFLHCTVL